MARTATALYIINRAAVEAGLIASPDPYASTDESYIQLRGLLDAAGQELVELHDWQTLLQQFDLTTAAGDTGKYPLPDDFSHMVDQTGWDRTNDLPLGGPLNSQEWAYLDGRDFGSSTIYASFRLADNSLQLYPTPVPEGINIRFEYVSRNWVQAADGTTKDLAEAPDDIITLDPLVMIKFLKHKFLQAKGFDTAGSATDLENIFNSRTGKDAGASVLNAGGGSPGYPYLGGKSIPFTGYGTL